MTTSVHLSMGWGGGGMSREFEQLRFRIEKQKKAAEKENKVFPQSCVKAALNRGIQGETKPPPRPPFKWCRS